MRHLLSILLLLQIYIVVWAQQQTIYGDINFDKSDEQLFENLLYKADSLYFNHNNDSLASSYAYNAIEIAIKLGDSSKIAKSMANYADYMCDLDEDESIQKGQNAKKILIRRSDTINITFAQVLDNIAYCYSLSDNDSLINVAINYCFRAQRILKKISDTSNYEYANSMAILSQVYYYNCNPNKAIDCAKIAIQLTEKATSRKMQMAFSLATHNLVLGYHLLGKINEAIYVQKQNTEQRLKLWGKTGMYAISLRNLAQMEIEIGDYKSAEEHLLEAVSINIKKMREIDTTQTLLSDCIDAMCLLTECNIYNGNIYDIRTNYASLQKMTHIYDFTNDSILLTSFIDVSMLYWLNIGNFEKAYEYLKESEKIYNGLYRNNDLCVDIYLRVNQSNKAHEIVFKDEKSTLSHYYNRIKTSFYVKNWTLADICIKDYIDNLKDKIRLLFPTMTHYNRELFMRNNEKSLQEIPSYINVMRTKEQFCQLYNLILLQKGLRLRTDTEFNNLLYNNDDKEAIGLYKEIEDLIVELNNKTNRQTKDSISLSIEHKLHYLEKKIPGLNLHLDISWEDVRNALTDDEIAIEFTDIFDPSTNNYNCKALVVSKESEYPYYIDLCNERNLPDRDFGYKQIERELFAAIWDPIINSGVLKGKHKIYFSPSNLLAQYALESLSDYNNNRLCDEFDLYRLSSTKELIYRGKNKVNYKNAILYGGLEYNLSFEDFRQANHKYAYNSRGKNNNVIIDTTLFRLGVKYLPGTLNEINSIKTELNKHKYKTLTYVGKEGTEESLYSLHNREIGLLHIATHGFYWDEYTAMQEYIQKRINFSKWDINSNSYSDEMALNRTGLFMSGANIALTGGVLPDNTEDGIVTAKEISKLYFKKLDFVVLSACRSGNGEGKDGEGILGLQRAFKKAGAHSILMSLWDVDDYATQILMVEFYKHYLNGDAKIIALKKAQNKVRSIEHYENPKYWAGFILLDAID